MPNATTSNPIPVEPIAPFIDSNALTAVFPKFTNASLASVNWSIPAAKAIALWTFNKVFSTSSLWFPTNAIAPWTAAKPPATPVNACPKPLNFASGLNESVNAFASAILSFNSAALFAASLAWSEVAPNFSANVWTSICACLSCCLKLPKFSLTSNSITFFSAIIL